jgi:predicted MPP superfamily phosphohydrolase
MRGRLGQAVLAPNFRFRVQKWQVTSPLWQDRPPLRIGILSDLHWGYRPVTPGLLAAVKRRLSAVSPDMIVFLGDLSEGLNPAAKLRNGRHGAERLSGLDAPLGCFAVLGNHDWHDDEDAQARRAGPVAAVDHLTTAGFTVLQNHSVRPGRNDIWLSGLESQQAFKGRKGEPKRLGAHDLAATLEQAAGDDPIILLAHEPDIFPEIDDPRIVLTLSGHMHAGQIRPFGKALYAPSRHGTRFAYGRYEDGANTLIVSGGLGCSTIPLRIGIMPELTVVEISGP